MSRLFVYLACEVCENVLRCSYTSWVEDMAVQCGKCGTIGRVRAGNHKFWRVDMQDWQKSHRVRGHDNL